jgi:hypothetical protein
MTSTIPTSRRAEGLSYWGLATVLAIGVAPALGFWVYQYGWFVLCLELAGLNLLMAGIAWLLPDDRAQHQGDGADDVVAPMTVGSFVRSHIEWLYRL